MSLRGLILAGGNGSRLYPCTAAMSKQLLPVYDKPMIYYPLSVLMFAGIRNTLIISAPDALQHYKRLLGSGSRFGISLQYAEQPRPEGLAQAFLIGEEFITGHICALALGDNFFYGEELGLKLRDAAARKHGATIYGYKVNDPQSYGIVELDTGGRALSIEEKPKIPKSNIAVTGLYFYDNNVIDIAKRTKLSSRGEFEISCINRAYLEQGNLHVELLGGKTKWFDMGTYEALFKASQFVRNTEKRIGIKIACLEEIAWRNGWLGASELQTSVNELGDCHYASYIQSIATTT